MTHSAVERQVFVRNDQWLRGHTRPITLNPEGRFVVTLPGQTPQEAWEVGLP